MLWNRKSKEPIQENVTQITNDYVVEKNFEKQQTQAHKRISRRRNVGLAAFATILLLPLSFNLIGNISHIREVEDQIVLAQKEKKALEKENQQLNVQVGLLQDDEYVAKLARSRYYFSKDGEIIFSLPEDNQSKAANKVDGEN